jgi:hypothetical protein
MKINEQQSSPQVQLPTITKSDGDGGHKVFARKDLDGGKCIYYCRNRTLTFDAKRIISNEVHKMAKTEQYTSDDLIATERRKTKAWLKDLHRSETCDGGQMIANSIYYGELLVAKILCCPKCGSLLRTKIALAEIRGGRFKPEKCFK